MGMVIQQDSKSNSKLETTWVALLSDLCAIQHTSNLFIHKLVKIQLLFQTETKLSVFSGRSCKLCDNQAAKTLN